MVRQGDSERRPLVGLAGYPDSSSESLDDLSRNPQTETETAILLWRYGSHQALKDSGLILGSNPDSLVPNHQHRRIRARLQRDGDRFSCPIFDRIGKQVFDDLVQALLVPIAPYRTDHFQFQKRAGLGEPFLCSTSAARSTSSSWRSSRSEVIRETSSRLSISSPNRRVWRRMVWSLVERLAGSDTTAFNLTASDSVWS